MRAHFQVYLALLAVPLGAQAPSTWRLELSHAIRPGEGTPGAIGDVLGMVVRDDGAVYLSEQNPARVTLYDKTGAYLRTMMRQGSGPGETRFPEIAIRGDTLIVYDPALMRLTKMASSGKVISEFTKLTVQSSGGQPPIWVTDNGQVLIRSSFPIRGSTDNAVRVAPNGHVDTLKWQRPITGDLSIRWQGATWIIVGQAPFSPEGVSTFDPLGRLILGNTRHSRWFVLSGRDTIQTVSLPDHEIPIVKSVRDSVWEAYQAKLDRKLPNLDDVVRKELIPTTLPPWVTFDIDRRGAWWIGKPGGNGVLASWDIVENGHLTGHAAVPETIARNAGAGSRAMVAFGRDVVALLHTDRNGLPWVGVYNISRKSP